MDSTRVPFQKNAFQQQSFFFQTRVAFRQLIILYAVPKFQASIPVPHLRGLAAQPQTCPEATADVTLSLVPATVSCRLGISSGIPFDALKFYLATG